MDPDWVKNWNIYFAPTGPLCEAVSIKKSGQADGTGWLSGRFEGETLHLQVFCSALGRTRTCGLLIRSQPRPSAMGRYPPSQTAILQGFLLSL
jgi:hypothetical protein